MSQETPHNPKDLEIEIDPDGLKVMKTYWPDGSLQGRVTLNPDGSGAKAKEHYRPDGTPSGRHIFNEDGSEISEEYSLAGKLQVRTAINPDGSRFPRNYYGEEGRQRLATELEGPEPKPLEPLEAV